MFPALARGAPLEIPLDLRGRVQQYTDIAAWLPALIRRSSMAAWSDRADLEIAAREIFSEQDGVHSFFCAPDVSSLIAVATYLSKGSLSPYKSTSYFFVLPHEFVTGFALPVELAPHESSCAHINALHRHVTVDDATKARLFAAVQERGCFNYRVDKSSLSASSAALTGVGCLEYSAGPCSGPVPAASYPC